MVLTRWPPRSADLTPCGSFLWEDRVFVPSLPVSVNDLKQRITTAVASVDKDILWCVWNRLDYCIDICRSHINFKTYTKKKTCKYFGYINNTLVSIKR
jgi:hypothetical protein